MLRLYYAYGSLCPSYGSFKLVIISASHQDVIELGKKIAEHFDVTKHLGDQEKMSEMVSHFREVGGQVTFAKYSNANNKKLLANAFAHYPKAWAEYLGNRQVLTRKFDRGYFAPGALTPSARYYDTRLADFQYGYVSIAMEGMRKTTPYHEIGHLVQWANPEVVRIEKEWVDRRTQNDEYVTMDQAIGTKKPMYDRNEVTKPDAFVSPYVGKYYDNFTEVLSTGLEGLFVDERYFKKYDRHGKKVWSTLDEDPEMLHLTLGLLVKG